VLSGDNRSRSVSAWPDVACVASVVGLRDAAYRGAGGFGDRGGVCQAVAEEYVGERRRRGRRAVL